jgi:hypothetical protein
MLELSEIKYDVTWKQAMDYAKRLGKGWRLPSKKELQIIEASPKSKNFATEGLFWSSSTDLNNTDDAWTISLGYGDLYIDGKSDIYNARCIRGSFEDLIAWCFGKLKIDRQAIIEHEELIKKIQKFQEATLKSLEQKDNSKTYITFLIGELNAIKIILGWFSDEEYDSLLERMQDPAQKEAMEKLSDSLAVKA